MAIIVISHEMGAGGPEIGQLLAQRLGYRYVDQEPISHAAQRYGLLEEKPSHLDEAGQTPAMDALRARLSGRPVLLIAHRPELVRYADVVATLDEGTLTGVTTPRPLGGVRT